MDKFNGGLEEHNLAFKALQRDLEECKRERDHQKIRADELEKEVDALKAENQLNKKQQDALKDELEESKKCFSERELKHKTEVVCRLRDQKECIQALQKDFAESLREKDLQDRRLRDKNEAYEALQSFFEFSLKERDYLSLRINELEEGKLLLKEVDVLKVEASTKDQLNKKQINALKAKLKKQTTFFSELSSQLSPEVVCRPKDLKEALQELQRDLAESLREKDLEKLRADKLAGKNSSLEKEVDALKAENQLSKKQQDALKEELEELKKCFSERELKHKTEVVCRLRDQKECIQALQKDFAESLREKDLQDRRLRDKNEAYEALQSFFEFSLKERDYLSLRINELEKGKSLLEEEIDVLKVEVSTKDQLNKKQINALKAKLKKQTTFFSELSSQLSPEVVCRPKDLKEALQAQQRDLAESLREKDLEKLRADKLAGKNSSLEKEVDALKAEISAKDQLSKKQQDALKEELEELKKCFSERELKHKTEVVCRLRDQKECIQALQKDFAESLREKDLQDRRLRDKNEAYEALQSFFEFSLKERDYLSLRINELEKGKSLLEEEIDVLKVEVSTKDQLNKKQINALKAKLKKQTTFFSELSSQLSPEVVCRPKDLKEALQAQQRDLAESLREKDLEKLRADKLAGKNSSLEKEVDALKAEISAKDQLSKKQQDALKEELEELKKCFSERELKHKTEVVCRLRDQKECIQALQKDFAESLREKDLQDRRLRDKNEAYEALQSFFEFSLKERDYLSLRINELEKGKSLLEEEIDVLKVEVSTKDQLNKKQINALKAKLKKQTTFFSELSSQLSPEVVCRPKDLKEALQAQQRDLAESLREKDLEKLRADKLAGKNSSLEKEVDALKAEISAKDQLSKKQQDALKEELEELKKCFSERELKHKTEVVCRLRDQKECIQALQKDFAESLREKDLQDRRLRDKNEAYEALQSFFEFSLKERDYLSLRINELEKGKSLLEEEIDVLKVEVSTKDQLNKKQINALKAKLKKQTTFFSELSSQLSPEVVCRPKDLKEALQAQQRDLAESLREKDLEKLRADKLAGKNSSLEKEVDALKDQASFMDKQYKMELDTLKAKLKKQTTFFSELSSLLSPGVLCRPKDLKEALQALQRDLAESLREKDLEKLRGDKLAKKMSSWEKEVEALKDQASFMDKQYKKELDALKDELMKKNICCSELSSQLKAQGENNISLQRELDELHIEREHHMKSVHDLRKDIEEAKELVIEAENISAFRRAKKYFTPNRRRQFKLQMKLEKLGQE